MLVIDDSEIRCPSCRGAKKVPKLGGMIGECNTCTGTGKIKSCDRPARADVIPAPITNEIITEVARVVPIAVEIAEQVKLDTQVKPQANKKVLYKRKKA